jgi:hypothetical protein
VGGLRSLAAARGRRPQVWIAASVEAAPTAAQAHATVARFVEQEGDAKAMENFLEWMMGGSHMSPERRKSLIDSAKEIGRGYPIALCCVQLSEHEVPEGDFAWRGLLGPVPARFFNELRSREFSINLITVGPSPGVGFSERDYKIQQRR